MNDDTEISWANSKRFTLDEARAVLPEVRRLTSEAAKLADPLLQELESNLLDDTEREELQEELSKAVQGWARAISELGAVPKGTWLVDFDSGTGFYCWRFGEDDVEYFHPYDSGFQGRQVIQ